MWLNGCCMTRNLEATSLSNTGPSGYFCGTVPGEDTSEAKPNTG